MANYYPATALVESMHLASGAALSGGTLSAFLSGTSTATNMFTDKNGTSAGGVVTLNSRGEPEVSGAAVAIWLDDDLEYKFILKDSSGSTIWTVDGYSRGLSNVPRITNVSPVFDTVAAMKASSSFVSAGLVVQTKGYYSAGDSGHAQYLIKTAADYGVTPDEYSDHTLNNGNIAVLQYSGKFNVRQFGAKGDASNDDAAAIQAALDVAISVGGEVFIPAGKYKTTSMLSLDNTGNTGAPNSNTKRVNIVGEGEGNTVILPSTDGITGLKIIGDPTLSSAGHGYIELSSFSFGGNSPTSRTCEGLELEDIAYVSVNEIGFHNLDTCLVLDGCLSSNFRGLAFNESVTGVTSTASASGPHANYFSGCEWRQLTTMAYNGFTGLSQAVFIGCQIEGNGTHGDSAKGGMLFRLNGSAGEVGPTFIGCYFEGNGGGFDIDIQESASVRIAVSVIACNFNRNSSSKYVTNNIKTSGDVNLTLQGNAFTSYNTYTPNSGRRYLSLGATTVVSDAGGNRFEDSTEGPTLGRTLHYAGAVDGSAGASVTGVLPNGWSVSQDSTGTFRVTHNLGHTNYAVTASATGSTAVLAQRCPKTANYFQVVLRDLSNVASDVDFDFSLAELKPIA